MILIVSHHYVVNSGLMDKTGPVMAAPMSANSIFLLLFGAWGKTGINCFVLITGYFMCKQDFKPKKYARLVLEWLFYKYIFLIIFMASGYEPFEMKNFVKHLLPIYQINKGFTSCFFLFYLFIPFLNIMVKNMTKKQHTMLMLLTGFVYVVFGTVHTVSFNYVTWFCVLFIIGSYLRLYAVSWMDNRLICGCGLIVSICLSATSVIICAVIGKNPFFFVTDSNTMLAVLTGVFAFLFFKNIDIPYISVINTVAASTFGVFLIHANCDSMRRWLWRDVIDCVGHYNDKLMPLYAILCVIGIFIVCTVIDFLRIQLLENPIMKVIERKRV